MGLKYIDEADLQGKRVLARFDFNVPLDGSTITDTTRIDLALPTIKYILDHGASKLVLMSHLGRPKGQANTKYSLEPVAQYLAQQLGEEVLLTEAPVDSGVLSMLKIKSTKIVLLQNLRYNPGEESDDSEFASKLAEYGDIYVNDAFGAVHRKHASVHQINSFFDNTAFGGFLLKKEIQALSKIVDSPEKPFMAIVGGAKVADKIKILDRLLPNVQSLFIGGAMAYPFLKAQEHEVGQSLCGEDDVVLAKKILAQDKHKKIILPIDHIVSTAFDGEPEVCATVEIPTDKMGLDIGPETQKKYAVLLKDAKTILWNGPMGIFENPNYAKGTFAIAQALSDSNAFTVVGGGDSVSAVKKAKLEDRLSHVSTGGGASLEFIQNGQLPGVQALKFGV